MGMGERNEVEGGEKCVDVCVWRGGGREVGGTAVHCEITYV